MMIHKVLARKRKARKRPSGFVPATYFNVGNGDNNNSRSLPDPEMSQTQSSPLISTAMAAHVASRHSIAPSSAYSSASPIPVTILSSASSGPHRSLSTSLSASTSSHRRASLSETEASSHWPHEPLINPYEMPPPAWSISNQNPTSTATGITTPSPTLSRVSQLPSPAPALMPNVLASIPLAQPGDTNLLRSMTAHQKALEAEGEKSLVDSSSSANASSSALASETKKDNQYDPPPQYRD
ncbi:hypothetical protein BJ165DRAFT_1457258 [Panaeolus papilionaceus]|nr:hypothetical protein BJ165DRAFT_1457258 [Panaeolus papilionaceus]